MQSGGPSPLPSFPASRDGTPSGNGTNTNGTTNGNTNGTNGTTNGVQKRTKICVYCGASPGFKPQHMEAARELARIMAENNIDLGESLFSRFSSHSSLSTPHLHPRFGQR